MKKSKLIAFCLIFVVIVSITSFRRDQNSDEYSKNKDLRLSVQDITLITPKNKTYTSPMSGYYPATYEFENDVDGTVPNGWTDEDLGGATTGVLSSYANHNKVINMHDTSGSQEAGTATLFSKTSGTIEFWWRTTSATNLASIRLLDDPSGYAVYMYVSANQWVVSDSGSPTSLRAAAVNTWYHIRLDFETESGGYEGLAADTFYVYIDGVRYGPYGFHAGAQTHMDKFKVATEDVFTGDVYVDSVGFSWDPNYNIGDNFEEGLFLSFENSTVLDWTGYSLDNQLNKTILSNTTIPIPDDGLHTIQVFGNDSIGTIHESDIRHFSIEFINIITPKNKTYTSPMSGYYPATYEFENDVDGTIPIGWTDEDIGGATTGVLSSYANHNKVINMHDTSGSQEAGTATLFSKTSGTIEFWWRTTSATNLASIRLLDDPSGYAVYMYVSANQWVVSDSGSPTSLRAAAVNTWYHIRLDFETESGGYEGLAADTFYVYIDGVRYGPYGFHAGAQTHMDKFKVATEDVFTGDVYVDSVGFSWDPNYNIGDNFEEGLFLSFENSTVLDWTGYSLDYQANKTILGNTTIPIPEEGLHTIQVFGNNSVGKYYKSELRNFEIDLNPPIVSINSPALNQYYGSNTPSFDLSITELNLNSIWYTLDNGITNISFTGLTGIINQAEWDKKSTGFVVIKFYANDTYGRENYTEVSINKDITDPSIIIDSPMTGDIFTELPPLYDISVTEDNLDSMWYTIDGGVTDIPFTSSTGFIDSTAWNNAPYGAITVRFYAKDLAGNEVYQEVLIIKQSPSVPPSIIGYDIFVLISVVSIVSMLIIRKKFLKKI